MSNPEDFPPTESYWSASKRRFRQIAFGLLCIWSVDNALDHTLMFWRAHAFGENMCEALLSHTDKQYKDLVWVSGARPLGPSLSALFKEEQSRPWSGCNYSVIIGDTLSPFDELCGGVDYTIIVHWKEHALPTLRMRYDLLGNIVTGAFYGDASLFDLNVRGYHSYGQGALAAYAGFSVRPFVCPFTTGPLFLFV